MPAAGYVEMAWRRRSRAKSERVALEDLVFHRALTLSEGAERTVQTVLSRDESDGCGFEILSRPALSPEPAEPCWTTHASGKLRVDADAMNAPREDLGALRQRIAEPLSAESLDEA